MNDPRTYNSIGPGPNQFAFNNNSIKMYRCHTVTVDDTLYYFRFECRQFISAKIHKGFTNVEIVSHYDMGQAEITLLRQCYEKLICLFTQ